MVSLTSTATFDAAIDASDIYQCNVIFYLSQMFMFFLQKTSKPHGNHIAYLRESALVRAGDILEIVVDNCAHVARRMFVHTRLHHCCMSSCTC